ncbi:phosphotriesterase-related protein [Vanessa cardui]|uniref:phosphotriesterase-related protein n=1 Tax=Vanessa cardui TaxID=171605 RepID=UPI001F137C60|nr:phosphotriesterase-related protein [Vanessa cardui]XP_046968539.1 phosphotriesterase-related protein [Vanessa cardui]
MTYKIQTVLGDEAPEKLGVTLTHEHLAMNFSHFYRKPPKILADKFDLYMSLETIGYIRQYPYSSQHNLLLNDDYAKDAVLKDVELYKKCGGGCIVENTTEGLERDIRFYQMVSKKTGVKIVAGTGYYIADMQNSDSLHATKENLYDHMLKELTEGCEDYPAVQAGFIGEIASVWPLRDFERKAIIAAGEVQAQVNCGVSFHPHRVPEAPFKIIRLYLEAGGRANKAVMSHLDRTLLDPEKLLDFSDMGTYCQFDLFGTEVSYYQLNIDTDMPSDSQRLDMIHNLLNNGKAENILISHDIHTKHRLTSYGGHGYSHILTNVIPRMKSKGMSQEVIDSITIHNPAQWLTIRQ